MEQMTRSLYGSRFTGSGAEEDSVKRKEEWHSSFCAAMRLELKQDENSIQFADWNPDGNQGEMNVLLIKKPEKYTVENIIGQLFRRYNIWEYIPQGKELDVDAFYRMNGYACLFKSGGSYADDRKADNITLSLVRDRKPEPLLLALEKTGFTVARPFPGIYSVGGKAYFRTQIIAAGELPEGQCIWLKSMAEGIGRQTAKELLAGVRALKQPKEKALADSVFAASVRANRKLYAAWKEEEDVYEALKELMADEMGNIREDAKEEGKAEGKREGKEEGIRAFVESCLELGIPYGQVEEKLERKFRLSGQETEEYMGRYWR